MKIFLKTSFIIALLTSTLFAHKEWAHQYIVREAYRYLELKLSMTYPDLKNHIGFNFDGFGDENDPWSTGYIGVAAWMEDKNDPVWGYGTAFNGWTASSTHFWNADLGDNVTTPIFASSDVPNAYTKARIYLFGGQRLFFMNKSWSYEHQQVILGRFYSYNSLVEFFQTGKCYYEGYIDLAGYVHLNSPQEIYMDIATARKYSYQILGRVAHLLHDMSVPAHVHDDAHPCELGDPDDYELYMGGNSSGMFLCNDVQSSFPAQSWNKYTASAQGNLIDILSMSDYDGIRYLFYTLNQLSDHFPSRERSGDNNLPNGSNSYLISRYRALGAVPPNAVYQDIGNETFNYAIRATATLFNWFATRVGLSTTPITPLTAVYLMGDFTLYAGGTGRWYTELQNGMEPFSYSWQIMYLDGTGYLQTYESVKKEKEKREKDKDKKKDGDIIIELAPSNSWVTVGTNSSYFSKPHNPYDLRDFKLKCTVTDATNTTKTSNEFYVDVVSYPPDFSIVQIGDSKEQSIPLAKESEVISMPRDYSLDQNYPNPFNPTTIISYSLPEASFVTLKVFDILGREMTTLINEVKQPGKYEVEFNASKLPSGTYVYKLTAGKSQTIRKMLLIK